MSAKTRFLLNGQLVATSARPDMTVLDFLRTTAHLHGTKEGCAEGDCGACTVLLARPNIHGGKRVPVNSCIMTLAQLDGASLTTVEGIKQNGILSALQQAMAQNGASQCGFCTPGIVMAATGLLEKTEVPTENEIHDALAGNLCRCTGYRPIVEAVQSVAAQRTNFEEVANTPAVDFPASSKLNAAGVTVHKPNSLRALLRLKRDRPDGVLWAGGTDLGVAHAAYETKISEIISTDRVSELRRVTQSAGQFSFGAAVTWQEFLHSIAGEYPSLATLITRFGSTQIRSMGTIGGNIGTASPIGDGPPAMIALGATITLASLENGKRTMALEDFFEDYRKTALRPDEVIVCVTLPRAKEREYFRVWKVSKRYDQDISTVCGAFWLKLSGDKIMDLRIAYGGMAAIAKRARSAEAVLRGKAMTPALFAAAADAIALDFQPLSDWRGSASYRQDVAAGLVRRLEADLAGQRVEVMA